jgi:O-antigen biosynthesis alpha-1,2-mannosyltransferase
LRIALDATYSIGENLTGVGVYSNRIIDGVAQAFHPEKIVLAYRPHRLLRALRQTLPPNCGRRPLLDSVGLPAIRLFHGLNQRLPATRYQRTVCTFHDLFVMTGDYSTGEFRERFTHLARRAADRSDLIIAVSRFTATQVSELLDFDPARVRVVAHGIQLPAKPLRRKPEKMVLHVGAVQKRKNLVRLVEAFERLAPDWRLILAGSAGYGAEEVFERIRQSPARDRIVVAGYVDTRSLEDLYLRAGIFAFPSLDEGFGMPVLEAMARGIPVLTSRRSALPEVGGDAAFYADASQADDIGEQLLRLAQSAPLRAQLSARGEVHASKFSWETAATQTVRVYRELLR